MNISCFIVVDDFVHEEEFTKLLMSTGYAISPLADNKKICGFKSRDRAAYTLAYNIVISDLITWNDAKKNILEKLNSSKFLSIILHEASKQNSSWKCQASYNQENITVDLFSKVEK